MKKRACCGESSEVLRSADHIISYVMDLFLDGQRQTAAAYGRYRSAFQLKYYHQCQCSRVNQSTGPYALERIRLANMLFFSIPILVRVMMRHSLMGKQRTYLCRFL